MYCPSGLNTIRVIVSVCPASGGKICCHVVVSYSRMTACSALVALHDVAIMSPDGELATAMSCGARQFQSMSGPRATHLVSMAI